MIIAHESQGMFRSFRYRNFRLYAAGGIVSGVGTWMQRVAQDWLVLQLTGNALDVGTVVALQFISVLVFAPAAGVLVDRFSKRKLIAWSNAFMGVCALVLGILDITGLAEVWHVFVLAFVLGAASALENPARQAFTGEMVSPADLTNALSLGGTIVHGARLVGPAVAGVLIAVSGTGLVYLINAASFVAVVLSMVFMKSSLLTPFERSTRTDGTLRIGLAYLRSRPDLMLLLVIIGGSGVFGLNLQLSITLMVTGAFGEGATQFGILTSILAIGSVSGGLLGARIRTPSSRIVFGTGTVFGLMFVVSAVMPSVELYAISLVPLGTLCMLLMTSCSACFQLRVDGSMRGRLMGIYFAVMMGSTGIGAVVLGRLAEWIGIRPTLAIGGVLTVLIVCAAGAMLVRRDGAVSSRRSAE